MADIADLTDEAADRHAARFERVLREDMEWMLNYWQDTGQIALPDDHEQNIRAAFSDMIGEMTQVAGESIMDTLTKEEDGLWGRIRQAYLETFGGQKIINISTTTLRQVQAIIIDNPEMGQDELAAILRDRIPSLARLRAAVIARTETHSAAQFASMETAKTFAIPLVKKWNSVEDHRTRDFGEIGGVESFNHRSMDGVTAAMDEPFRVPKRDGTFEYLMFPGDPNGSAGNTINCRCVQTYVRVG